jgi:hypothetical protein
MTGLGMLVLFSAPETYGPSEIVGHYNDGASSATATANIKSQVAGNAYTLAGATYG